MFTSQEIQSLGSLKLSDRELLGLGGGDSEGAWDELTNIRLKQERGYRYWAPRGGSTDSGIASEAHKYGFFFKARVGASVNEYFARQTDGGDVKIYSYPALSLLHTISGFTTTGKVQFAPIGQLLYMFDGDQSKYINLRTGVVSDYLGTRSGDLSSYTEETTGTVGGIFPFGNGDKVILYSPNLIDFSHGTIHYRLTGGTDGNADAISADSEDVYNRTETNVNSFTAPNGIVEATFEALIHPGIIYKWQKGSVTPNNAEVNVLDNINYSSEDANGDVYFSVSQTSKLQYTITDDTHTIPSVREITNSNIRPSSEFYKTQLGTAKIIDGDLYVEIDSGYNIPVSDDRWGFVGYDETLESTIGGFAYDLVGTDIVAVGTNAEFTSYSYVGTPIDDDQSGDSNTVLYRSYVIVDILDDGSVTLPGRPLIVSHNIYSNVVGFTMNVTPAEPNVSKRYLLASKYSTSEDKTIRPTSQDYPNSPWFIAREVSKESSAIFDSTPNNQLVRPATEILPMAAGIPTVFGRGEVTPKTVSPHKDIFVIGGYTINRPTPTVHTSFPDQDGNIYVNNQGADTANTAYFLFEYTDGTYSNTESFTVKDGGCEATLHSLNSLVSKVYLFVNDGADTYKVKTLTQSDVEFTGKPFEVPIVFTGFDTESIPDDTQESVTLNNFVTVPVPPQQIFISAQGQVFGNNDIIRSIPLDYDTDKSRLRYRLLVFTDSDIQVGYVSEVPNQSNIGYDVDFEIVDESRRALNHEGITRIGGNIFFQDKNGIHTFSGNGINKVIPKERYPFLDDMLRKVVYNEREDELWFIFGGSEVYVIGADDGYRSVFDYGDLNINDGQWFDDSLHLLTDDQLITSDVAGDTDDLGISITATAISRYLSDHRAQLLLHEVIAYGIGGSASLYVDAGSARLEDSQDDPSDFQFSQSDTFGAKNNELYGALFTPRVRGVRPRIKLDITGDFKIENIEVKSSSLANEGQARITP